ncbi:MAG: 30S ribosome-binding factor RbfA [Candidatus Staskawiczbacteria bacterium]|nr:30S ribosome-binding factor RbfA [Candidatus Staskawiczbacteria bacterium]
MPSNRVEKVNSLLKREISGIILREISFPDGVMVTLTRVETTSNLIEAKVYVSTFPENKSGEVFKILNKDVFHIQQKINKKLNMRPIPKIKFANDEETGRLGRVEELLESLKKEEK